MSAGTPHIMVLGAGPAGSATALGLARLGYRVTVLGESRRFRAVEGVSQRVLKGLAHVGMTEALAQVPPPSPRHVSWNGDERQANVEHLIDRSRFDAALLADLRQAGVSVVQARVSGLQTDAGGRSRIRASTKGGSQEWQADFVVEARGRLAPSGRQIRRGPQTLSLLTQWQAAPGPAASAVESHPDGWVWMARQPDGRCYWQWTLDAAATPLPAREKLLAWCEPRRRTGLARAFFGSAALAAASHARLDARPSTPTHCLMAAAPGMLRVGDAAMAVDPLSGNGIFQSLSSALQAPAVIHTLFEAPARAAMAQRFHVGRIAGLFERFARIGRDFHRQETRWQDRPFWQARAQWPDDVPAHAQLGEPVRLGRAPVLNGSLIDEAEVVFTADQPLGIWLLDGQPLAPVVRAVLDGVPDPLSALPPSCRPVFGQWLRQHGLSPV